MVGDMNYLGVLVHLSDLIIFGKALEKHEKNSRKSWVKIIGVRSMTDKDLVSVFFSFYMRLVESLMRSARTEDYMVIQGTGAALSSS